MKFAFSYLSLFLTFFCYCQKVTDTICNNIVVIDTLSLKTFHYYTIIKENKSNTDEVILKKQVNIFSEKIPTINRIIENKNVNYYFPLYYSFDSKNSIVIIDKFNFIDLVEYLKLYITEQNLKSADYIISKKEYTIYKKVFSNLKIIKIKISVGFYNKYTSCMHLTGDFDEMIDAIFIIH